VEREPLRPGEGKEEEVPYGETTQGSSLSVAEVAGPRISTGQSSGKATAKTLKYRQNPNEGKGKNDEGEVVRMLDRIARIVLTEKTPLEGNKGTTPHLAATLLEGGLVLAGNTGAQTWKASDARQGVKRLVAALQEGAIPARSDKKREIDVTKLRALMSGDYQKLYKDPELDVLAQALRVITANPEGTQLRNIDTKAKGAEHGEMTLLGERLAQEVKGRQLRDDTQPEVTIRIGGVRKPCGACDWVFKAFNKHIWPNYGIKVESAETHGLLFEGWAIPDWLLKGTFPGAKEAVDEIHKSAGTEGVQFDGKGLLQVSKYQGHSQQFPSGSNSEWEEDK
jgi:hypothetical protein